ncbi:MAG: hypothetical protein PUA83_07985 [Clostridiales bacterium]|nr:hypothetical protein [Clostridiales bacterium]
MSVRIYEKEYAPFGKVLAMENDFVELCVTLDVGPRIIRFAQRGGENFMFEDRDASVVNRGEKYDSYYGENAYWRTYGGHRIWLTPEIEPNTYYPDNDPVEYSVSGNSVTFTPPEQDANQVLETLTVTLEENDGVAQVTATATNTADVPQTFGLWQISVMCPNGLGIFPQNTRDAGLLHNRTLSLWSYADMSDPRVCWGKNLISVRQDPSVDRAFKIGAPNERGWLAYLCHNALFVKRFPYFAGSAYPDDGCNGELYTNAKFLEIESLSKLAPVNPGDTLCATEVWSITPDVAPVCGKDMAALEKLVADYIEE